MAPLTAATRYWRNQCRARKLSCKTGGLELDNNRAERDVKPLVIGRKNWLFSDTPNGAEASAVIYNVVECERPRPTGRTRSGIYRTCSRRCRIFPTQLNAKSSCSGQRSCHRR